MSKAKLIGFRVPENSDLPDRLRAVGFRLRMQYGELLERWIAAEEAGAMADGKHDADTPAPGSPPTNEDQEKLDLQYRLEAIEARLETLEFRPAPEHPAAFVKKLAEIEARLTAAAATAETIAAPTKSRAPRPVKATKPAAKTKSAASAPARRSEPTDAKAAILAKVNELRSAGLSLRKMADRLNAESVPTLSGAGGWNAGTISKLLKKAASAK